MVLLTAVIKGERVSVKNKARSTAPKTLMHPFNGTIYTISLYNNYNIIVKMHALLTSENLVNRFYCDGKEHVIGGCTINMPQLERFSFKNDFFFQ